MLDSEESFSRDLSWLLLGEEIKIEGKLTYICISDKKQGCVTRAITQTYFSVNRYFHI